VADPTLSSASVLTFLPAGDCSTTESLLQLSTLVHLGKNRTENIVFLLLFNFCLGNRPENTIRLLFARRCTVTYLAVAA
jgi:hypothetical protein